MPINVNRFRVFAGSALVLLLSACSASHPQQANNGFGYLQTQAGQPLAIPAGVTAPVIKNNYHIPALAKNYPYPNYIGKAVDIRPPEQMISLVSGELRESADHHPQFWLDVPNALSQTQTQDWLYKQLQGYLTANHSAIAKVNAAHDQIESDWIATHQHIDNGVFNQTNIITKRRFRYLLKVTNQGRSAMIEAQLLDYSRVPPLAQTDLPALQMRRQNISELNRIVAYISQQRRQAQEHAAQLRQQSHLAQMNSGGQSKPMQLVLQRNEGVDTFVLPAPLQPSLDALYHALPPLGFAITDYIAESGQVYLSYHQPSAKALAPYDVKPVELPAGQYILTVGENNGATQVTVTDANGNVLSPQQMEKFYPSLKAMLSRLSSAS